MKKKMLVLLLILTMVCSIFALVACKDPNETPSGDIPSGVGSGDSSDKDDEQNQEHTHSYATTWTNDETSHWYASTCGHDVTKDKAEHSWDNDYICNICKYDNSNGLLFEINSDNTAYMVKGIKEDNISTEIVIPSRYKGIPVTNIGYKAFSNCSNLTSIKIPNSVTSIGSNAFTFCNNLASIVIPSSVISMGGAVFTYSKTIIYCEAESKPSGWYGGIDSHWNYGNCPVVWNYGGEHGETESGMKWGLTKNETITIYGYSGESTEVIIPETINGHSVASISDSAFYKRSSLTSIEIPDSVTSIGRYAFFDCNSLMGIEMPDSLTSIGDWAFYKCSSLTSIEIPSGVTSIGSGTFYNCSGLTGVYITDIANWCAINFGGSDANPLYYANNLYLNNELATEVVIPEGVTSIGRYAFYNYSSLTSIEIPNSVTSIGDRAFYYCSSLTGVYITDIASWCAIDFGDSDANPLYYAHNLYLNNELVTEVVIPDSVTSIGYAFLWCSSLTSIEIPSSVTSIGSDAFRGCRSLTSIEIPNSVTSIGENAFWSCNSLTSIEIPSSVTSIGENAFWNCCILTIYCEAESQPSGWNSKWKKLDYNNNTVPAVWDCKNNDIASDGNIYYVADNGIRYALKDGEATVVEQSISISGAVVIPSEVTYKGNTYSVTSIGNDAFYGCSRLTSIEIPSGVTSIGNSAFSDCSSLQYNEYDNGLYLGNKENPYMVLIDAKDTSITSCEINTSTKIIYSDAFEGCSSLTSIEIPSSVTSIGGYAFYNCSGLTSIEIPSSVTRIGNSAFYGCSSLTGVYITDIASWCAIDFGDSDANPLYYAHNLYLNNELVTELVIPSSVTSIGNYTFYNCSSLTSIEIPSSVTSIGSDAFEGCSSLTSIEIPSSVTSIGNYTFYNCSSLTSIVIPDSVTSIGNYAFSGCSKLTIYCEANSKPSGWDRYWNSSNRPVVWGYKG